MSNELTSPIQLPTFTDSMFGMLHCRQVDGEWYAMRYYANGVDGEFALFAFRMDEWLNWLEWCDTQEREPSFELFLAQYCNRIDPDHPERAFRDSIDKLLS